MQTAILNKARDKFTSKHTFLLNFSSSTTSDSLQLHEDWRFCAEVRNIRENLLASLGSGK